MLICYLTSFGGKNSAAGPKSRLDQLGRLFCLVCHSLKFFRGSSWQNDLHFDPRRLPLQPNSWLFWMCGTGQSCWSVSLLFLCITKGQSDSRKCEQCPRQSNLRACTHHRNFRPRAKLTVKLPTQQMYLYNFETWPYAIFNMRNFSFKFVRRIAQIWAKLRIICKKTTHLQHCVKLRKEIVQRNLVLTIFTITIKRRNLTVRYY